MNGARPAISSVSSLRERLWDAGFRPIPVYNHDAPGPSPGKRPWGEAWQTQARLDPPAAAVEPARPEALNTGVLCDGLRAVDLDIDNLTLAHRCRSIAIGMLGEAPVRWRKGSPRSLVVYRAAEGMPRKVSITGRSGKIEVLGFGQQFVAFGRHPEGAELEWFPGALGEEPLDSLPQVTEEAVAAFLAACAPVIGAELPKASNGHDHTPGDATADPLRIAAALLAIPNGGPPDWSAWNNVGMAVWRATNGSGAGWEAFNAWSSRNPAYDAATTRARWDGITASPPTQIGAGTIFHMAAEARIAEERAEYPGGGEDPPELPAEAAYEDRQAPGERPRPRRAASPSSDDADTVWATPLDFISDPSGEGPELLADHIPLAINDYVFDSAGRMGVDPTCVALAALAALASVMSDAWQVQPKRRDHSWTEGPRLWGAIVGDPSIMKTPIITATTRPIEALDAEARARHAVAMAEYKILLKAAKADKTKETPMPTHPKLDRFLVEGTSIEALSEVLRNDSEGRQRAPAGKVLCRQDEMSEFFANLDRYRPNGGKGSGDRGAYLRLYNGGPYVIDRIGRGAFRVPNWSCCFLGGIQPGPIQSIAKDATEDGLLQRFLFAVPGRQEPGQDRTPAAEALHRFEALFPVLTGLMPAREFDCSGAQVVVFHADAHQHREAVDMMARAMALMPDTTPQLKAALGKWPGLFARLALTYHLIEMADAAADAEADQPYRAVISEATARRAAGYMIDIALPSLIRAHKVMYSTVMTGHAAWIAGYVLAEKFARITTRDVVRAYRQLQPPEARDELAAVMESLVAIGWLEPETPANLSKPVHAWLVNPAVHVRFAERAERERARRASAHADMAAAFAAMGREPPASETVH
ncbi:MAG: DUF3987 domain-containing protein [Rhodopila sp.]|jgi:hypothetical protein